MPAEDTRGELPVRAEEDVVVTRQKVRALTQQLKFSLVDQTKMITAASELSRNTLVHGRGGRMRWEVLEEGMKRGLRLHFEDEGPGIADLRLALTDGWTSGAGMGLGLPGSKRLVHEFDVRSAPGQGTCVSITRWK
ncbi:anti-sigma regulatory factor [Ramlibacter tataouinensis]|uniref:Candidate signal transduction protein, serine/threonine protein kinase (Anti-sigma B factor) n=1 Tax=Ramlibacter tataouinensis (strain ATCC BAA-407 / DSM 14655 / LMG 21543 / TTB310) TaxID=365046 RepID=F5XZV7_RAMTT|nr:anti-sigma regulatory factor [Ramlibacter tataouinensis]AEG93318.1 Candidate signal transduction protein, serine/threonine protein kinase (Anti-sigma B factor) [Ramlibacter tataouinensis TTB310]